MKRTEIRRVSKRKAREDRKRAPLIAKLRQGPCEARLPMCTGRAQDGHELLSRAQGGSTTDPENVRGLCRACHTWVTDHPKEARAIGLAISPWGKE